MAHAEKRALYDPSHFVASGNSEGVGYAAGRPASASRVRQDMRPRSAGAPQERATEFPQDGWKVGPQMGSRARPTSAPAERKDAIQQPRQPMRGLPEEGDYSFNSTADQYGMEDVENYTVHVTGNIKAGKKVKSRRPISAPARRPFGQRSRPASAKRPTSAKASSMSIKEHSLGFERDSLMMLPDSGGMRFLRPKENHMPQRIFSPTDSPLLHEAAFVPTWAQLSTNLPEHHPARGGAWQPKSSANLQHLVFAENSFASARSSTGSHPSLAKPGSRPSSARPPSRPGSASGHRPASPSHAVRYRSASVVPMGAPRNPLATKTGTSMIKEIEGSFEPLQSQSMIPHYDAMHDPNLRHFWEKRKDIGRLMRITGQVRDEWAPDSGIFEACIGDELRRLYSPQIASEIRDVNSGPIAFPVRQAPVNPGALGGDLVSIEVSEEAVVGHGQVFPIPLSQPQLSVWLHWGKSPSARAAADLDLSAVMFDGKARCVETVFYRKLASRHEALTHTGDDTDVPPGEEGEGLDDLAAGARRTEGIVIELPRIPAAVKAVAFTACCYSDEPALAEAAGAEMRVCVGRGGEGGLSEDIVRYYLTSERYNAAAPCVLVRDADAESGWKLQTTAKVTSGSVVVEMLPALQGMLRQLGMCNPYTLEVEYCVAARPGPSLRGRSSDYSGSFRAVQAAVARSFPAVSVVGNPRAAWEEPRVGAFEVALVDVNAGRTVLWSKIATGKWPRTMETVMQRMQKAMTAPVPYEMPNDRSEVCVTVLDAATRRGLPWAVVELHALGLAAQKLSNEASKTTGYGEQQPAHKKKRPSRVAVGREGAEEAQHGQYKVQVDGEGVINMRLPGGRYEVWGLAEGYDCEYPLEMTVRPFSKHRVVAKVALAPRGKEEAGGGQDGAGAGARVDGEED